MNSRGLSVSFITLMSFETNDFNRYMLRFQFRPSNIPWGSKIKPVDTLNMQKVQNGNCQRINVWLKVSARTKATWMASSRWKFSVDSFSRSDWLTVFAIIIYHASSERGPLVSWRSLSSRGSLRKRWKHKITMVKVKVCALPLCLPNSRGISRGPKHPGPRSHVAIRMGVKPTIFSYDTKGHGNTYCLNSKQNCFRFLLRSPFCFVLVHRRHTIPWAPRFSVFRRRETRSRKGRASREAEGRTRVRGEEPGGGEWNKYHMTRSAQITIFYQGVCFRHMREARPPLRLLTLSLIYVKCDTRSQEFRM